MEEIIIDDYFAEITDEGRGTTGYQLISWTTNELVEKIICLNKAYKRKEAEIEELKKQNDYLSMSCECFKKDYFELKAESEELKKFCIESEKSKIEQHLQWQKRCTENHNENSRQLEKYKQALEKIEEKAKKYDANVGDTIIANPIQDLYDISQIIKECK